MVMFQMDVGDAGEYVGTITIHNNDHDESEYEITASANAGEPPQIVVDPNAIESDLRTGEIEDHVITISNDGDADLRWFAEVEILAEPERDAEQRNVRGTDGAVGPRRDDFGDDIAHL